MQKQLLALIAILALAPSAHASSVYFGVRSSNLILVGAQFGQDIEQADQGFGWRISVDSFYLILANVVSADVYWRTPIGRGSSLYYGAGAFGIFDLISKNTSYGLGMLLGAEFALNPHFGIFLEARPALTFPSYKSTSSNPVNFGFGFSFGGNFRF